MTVSDSEGVVGRMISSACAVIFDMDGVIVDSEPLHKQADAETFRHHGLEVPDDAWNTH